MFKERKGVQADLSSFALRNLYIIVSLKLHAKPGTHIEVEGLVRR